MRRAIGEKAPPIRLTGMDGDSFASQVARADSDPVTKARLDACVFKGAVKENGEWTAVSMCRMNQQKWSDVYAARSANPELAVQSQPWDRADLQTAPGEKTKPAFDLTE